MINLIFTATQYSFEAIVTFQVFRGGTTMTSQGLFPVLINWKHPSVF